MLCREFMLSAWNVACEFQHFINIVNPQAVVLFNGTHFPEASAAWLARQRGIRVITHESGFQPFSGYFVEGQATQYPIVIPPVDLTPQQEAFLDTDLQRRWQGDFSMAGVKFWNGMQNLPEDLLQKAAGFRQVVSVFTNVIFDTTQMYANVVFADMFTWLDRVADIMRRHPDTLFILRAHPDETRPGKTSRESVAAWYEKRASSLPNSLFIPPQEQIDSYDLVRRSKFVLTYNSTIGLEALLLGIPVLAAGQAPFNLFETVFCEADEPAYFKQLQEWLAARQINIPVERQRNTRRFLYYRTYRFSLPFGEFLEAAQPTGYVKVKLFPPHRFLSSPTGRALLAGILEGRRFEIDA
jgi:hypothetical protein